MSRVIMAVNAMLLNPQKISDVRQNGREYFFLYDGKYAWSIQQITDASDVIQFRLFFYPGMTDMDGLSRMDPGQFDGVPMIKYSTEEIRTREAKQTFQALYSLLAEKVFGIDEVFDDILKGDDIPF